MSIKCLKLISPKQLYMTKNNLRYLVILAGCLPAILLSGCVKHALDVKPVGQYTSETYWRNQSDVIAGINGIYNVLTQEEGVGHNLYAFDDQSDDIAIDGDHPDMWAIE